MGCEKGIRVERDAKVESKGSNLGERKEPEGHPINRQFAPEHQEHFQPTSQSPLISSCLFHFVQ